MDEQTIEDDAFFSDGVGVLTSTLTTPTRLQRSSIRPAFYGAIPQFPATKLLAITDQFTIEHWVRQFPPVSDFNFVSLWSWNTSGRESGIEVSWLNDNLVVLFKDYLSNHRFYSFLGINDVADTATMLLATAPRQGLESRLQLLPGVVIEALPPDQQFFCLELDESQKDYVLSTEEWLSMAGGKFRKKRNEIHHLERTMEPVFRPIDAGRSEQQQAMHDVFGRWVVQSQRAGNQDVVLQATALQRVFSLDRPGDLLSFGVFIEGKLRAFTINEPLHDGYALGHYCYGDHHTPGIYPYVLRETCRVLNAMGYRFLNTMQDLGQDGMKHAKTRTRPHHYFHKYALTNATGYDSEVTDTLFQMAARH